MSVLALIPARSGSKGIPGKNQRHLGGTSLRLLAVRCAMEAGAEHVVMSADIPEWVPQRDERFMPEWFDHERFQHIARPTELAQDDTPMVEVVKHALAQIPGPSDQIVCLLQPTQPMRKPTHVQQAVEMLRSRKRGLHSVVSVVPIPASHAPEFALRIGAGGELARECGDSYYGDGFGLDSLPTRRQDVEPTYVRDGAVYAFYRRTVVNHGNIYGPCSHALIIDPEDSCELDTEADWREVERRWKERS